MMTREKEENALEKMADYYLDTDHLPTLAYEAKKQAVMLFVSVSGAGLYVIIANNYVARIQQLSDHKTIQALPYILGNCISGLAVLYNSTDIFITTRGNETIPGELAVLLENPFESSRQRLKRDAVIVFFSALSSLPLATIGLSYHAGWMTPVMVWTQAIVTEIDNTLMHFLPIYLALKNPVFRFPVLPFEYVYKNYCKRENPADKKKLILDQVYQPLKQKLINQLSRAQNKIILQKITFKWSRLTYQVALDDELKSISNKAEKEEGAAQISSTGGALKKLTAITQYGQVSDQKEHHTSANTQSIVYVLGASWVTLSCIGYLVQPIDSIIALTGSETTGLICGLPPLYFLMVLMIYFGGNMLQSSYDYFASCGENQIKIPLEFRLYPKASLLCMTLVGYLTAYSYGGASELIYTNFADTNLIRPILLLISQTGISFLSGSAMIDFSRLLINKYALHYGKDETKMVARLNAMIDQLKIGISLMNGEKLVTALEALSVSARSKLGITVKELQETRKKLKSIESQSTESKARHASEPGEDTPLLASRSNSLPSPSASYGCFSRFYTRWRGKPVTRQDIRPDGRHVFV